MEKNNNSVLQKKLKIGLIIACIGACLLSAFFIGKYYLTAKDIRIKTIQESIRTTKRAANLLDQYLQKLVTEVDSIANDISSRKLPYNNIAQRLKEKPKNISGLGIAFAPYAFDQKVQLYSLYIYEDEKQKNILLEDDYTKSKRFISTLAEGSSFHEPFFDKAANTTVIEYSTPIYNEKHQPIGIVFANYSLEDMVRKEAELFTSNLGFAEIISDKGLFISTPDYQLVEQKTNALVLQQGLGNIQLANNVKKALKGELESFTDVNSLSGQESLIIFEHMKLVPWYTVGVFTMAEIEPKTLSFKRLLKSAVLLCICFVILLLLLILGIYKGNLNRLWIGATIISFGFILGIMFLWYHAFIDVEQNYKDVLTKPHSNEEIIKLQSVPDTEEANARQDNEQKKEIIVTPAGIYIHELTVGLDNVSLSGFFWQQYPIKDIGKFKPGILFPQAINITTQELYTMNENEMQTKGWSINGTFKQQFNYTDYPFDFQHINIALWPNSFDEHVVLVPDLNGYKVLNPTSLPGINNQIRLQSWVIDQSYFSYSPRNLLTNFGIHMANTYLSNNRSLQKKPLVLNFNAIVIRHYISTIVLSLLPIIIILVLLFIVLLVSHLIQFHMTLGSIASLFFTALLAYGNFKANIPIQQVVFFDYLYFLVQAIILLISIISIIFYMRFNIYFITYKQMIIPQLLYWPLVTAAIFLTTIIFFF